PRLSTARTRFRGLRPRLSTVRTRFRGLRLALSTARTRFRGFRLALSTARTRFRGLRRGEPGERPQQGRLAGPVRPGERHPLRPADDQPREPAGVAVVALRLLRRTGKDGAARLVPR